MERTSTHGGRWLTALTLIVPLQLGCSDSSAPTSPTPVDGSATAASTFSLEMPDGDEPPDDPGRDTGEAPDPDLDVVPIPSPEPLPTPIDESGPVNSLACPDPILLVSPRGEPVVVDFEVPSRLVGGARATAACRPRPGSRLSPGDHEVLCTRTDRTSDDSACTFLVTVLEPDAIIRTPAVLAYGDSITEGFLPRGFTSLTLSSYETLWGPRSHDTDFDATSYPTQLRGFMEERYGPEVRVVNGGRGGETTDDGEARFDGVFQSANPDLVLLLEGVNSVTVQILIAENTGGNPSTTGIASDLRSIVRKAQNGGADVLIATLTQIGDSRAAERPGMRSVIEDLNRRIRDLAGELGIGPAVDVYNKLSRSFISADGLHPTREGYIRLAEIFFDEMVRRFEVPKLRSMLRPPGVPDPADGRLFVRPSYRVRVVPSSTHRSGH